MKWRLWRRQAHTNGVAAKLAKLEAERRLAQARRDWPKVRQTRDQLAEWIASALRGQV